MSIQITETRYYMTDPDGAPAADPVEVTRAASSGELTAAEEEALWRDWRGGGEPADNRTPEERAFDEMYARDVAERRPYRPHQSVNLLDRWRRHGDD